jgi:hypothetical protein
MKDPRNYLIIALVAAIAFVVGQSSGGREALGQSTPGGTADSNNVMIAVTGTIGSGVSVLWVIDSEQRQLACYRSKGGKTIELVAARNIEWDLKVAQFHDESLMRPDQLKKLYLGGSEDGPDGMMENPVEAPTTPESGTVPGKPKEGD